MSCARDLRQVDAARPRELPYAPDRDIGGLLLNGRRTALLDTSCRREPTEAALWVRARYGAPAPDTLRRFRVEADAAWAAAMA